MKRPFRTEYYADNAGKSISSHGHSCSEQGSVRGAVVRIFMKQHSMARVYHEGVPLFSIRRTRIGVQVRYGRS